MSRALIVLAAVTVVCLPLAAEGGTFSGANGPIAYTCGSNICTVAADGTSPVTLISPGTDPSFSQDTVSIAYVDPTQGVVAANADGSGVADDLSAGATSTQPSYSFSNQRVAFIRSGNLFTILDNTTGSENTIRTSGTAAEPSWSPDGTRIAFVENAGATGFDIFTCPQVGTCNTPVHITSAAGDEHSPNWSPDASKLVYSAGNEIFTVTAASNGTVTDLHVQGTDPVYSPDGAKIAYVDAGGHLAVMTSSGGSPAAVPGNLTAADPDWQRVVQTSTGQPPTNVVYPKINLQSGDTQPILGHFLTATVGTWDGELPINYDFQWKRCDAADPVNGVCVEIPGATSSFYTPGAADVGKRLRVAVTATNAKGKASQNSEVTAAVIALAPKNGATPLVVGGNPSPVVDTPLDVSGGTWSGSTPITFTYSWRRCNPPGDIDSCVAIPGATASTYTPVVADIGLTLRVWVTGTNPAGSDTVITLHTFPVIDKEHFAPSPSTDPLVGGTAALGRQLTANIGDFAGDAPIKTTFAWQRCDATGGACHVIASAKKVVYFPTAADVGYTLRIIVNATNAYGKMSAQSVPTEPIAQQPPHVKGRHIVGTARSDYKAGGGHDDTIEGLDGNDTLVGGAGDDRIEGGAGNDIITGGAGADKLFGGAGSDTIYAADGERDTIDCGAGRDRVVADDVDKTIGCEVISSPPSSGLSPGAR